jgi:hypothetical protein
MHHHSKSVIRYDLSTRTCVILIGEWTLGSLYEGGRFARVCVCPLRFAGYLYFAFDPFDLPQSLRLPAQILSESQAAKGLINDNDLPRLGGCGGSRNGCPATFKRSRPLVYATY